MALDDFTLEYVTNKIDKKIKKYQNHLQDIADTDTYDVCPDRYIHQIEGKLSILKELKKEFS